MDRNIINIKHLLQNLNYVLFWYSSWVKYKIWYFISTILKPFSLFINWSIKNHFPFPGKYKIKNFYWKFEIIEPSDMHWILSPYSEKELTEEFLEVNNWIFLDIWTNIWKYSILMAKNWMDVFSFEPNPEIFSYLKRNISLNWLTEKIHVINSWIWEPGSFHLHIPKWNNFWSWTFLKKSLWKIEIQKSIKCKIDSINNIIKKNNINIKDLRLIKIDTEWYEFKVIKSFNDILWKLENCKIIIEIDSDNIFNEINKILSNHWFKLKVNHIKNYIFIKQK